MTDQSDKSDAERRWLWHRGLRHLWTTAHDNPDYVKAEWGHLSWEFERRVKTLDYVDGLANNVEHALRRALADRPNLPSNALLQFALETLADIRAQIEEAQTGILQQDRHNGR
jgi:hypothetical protein